MQQGVGRIRCRGIRREYQRQGGRKGGGKETGLGLGVTTG